MAQIQNDKHKFTVMNLCELSKSNVQNTCDRATYLLVKHFLCLGVHSSAVRVTHDSVLLRSMKIIMCIPYMIVVCIQWCNLGHSTVCVYKCGKLHNFKLCPFLEMFLHFQWGNNIIVPVSAQSQITLPLVSLPHSHIQPPTHSTTMTIYRFCIGKCYS